MDVRHPASLARVTLHQRSNLRRLGITAAFVVLYAVALQWCYTTSGEPYATALAEAEKLRRANMTADEIASQEELTDMGYPVLRMEQEETELEKLRGAAGLGVGAAEAEGVEGDRPVLMSLEEAVNANASTLEALPGASKDKDERPLPKKWLPNAWACAFLFALCTANVLVYMLCKWLIWFRAGAVYCTAEGTPQEGMFAQVLPHAHRGKPDITPLVLSARTGRLTFMFQRQRYEFLRPAEMHSDRAAELVWPKPPKDFAGPKPKPPSFGARLVTNAVDKAMISYAGERGLSNEDVTLRLEQYGPNHLEIHTPRFIDLYQQQLGSPIAMFQFFSATLWMLDEYWQFTMFTLVSILMFEGTTAFQRMKTFGQLNSMSAKPYGVQVFRAGAWTPMSTRDLLPGDLISLKLHKKGGNAAAPVTVVEKLLAASNEIVPCDCVVLRGSAVVNEATLTGESVPQMKDSLPAMEPGSEDAERAFDLEGHHRVHVLFSGTSMIQVNSGCNDDDDKARATANKAAAVGAKDDVTGLRPLPYSPDGGALCVVVRTGFSSSQGELIQMIEFSSQQVALETKETLCALLVLMCFALVAAGYVLKKGLADGDRTTHELLLRCTIILTSVVPRSLPTQMAMAVNTALMALHKNGIMCTEPFRVTFAGKISHCLFDKTGTLTTDTLVPVGVVNNNMGQTAGAAARPTVPVNDAAPGAAMVLAACHSLVKVEGTGVVGDPIEVAALRGVQWSYDPATQQSTPGAWLVEEKAAVSLTADMGAMDKASVTFAEAEIKLAGLTDQVEAAKAQAKACALSSVKIVQRHHFASELQRMSVVAEAIVKDVSLLGGLAPASGNMKAGKQLVCLVKGSPEAVGKLLTQPPPWYTVTYKRLAERGMRVLALACRWVPADEAAGAAAQPRAWVEQELTFCGFVAFACRVRTDSRTVVSSLRESEHKVAMITGDAALTALHVACEVAICTKRKVALELMASDGDGAGPFKAEWVGAVGDDPVHLPFECEGIELLAEEYELLTTEAALECVSLHTEEKVYEHVEWIKVFARMSPQGKSKVIRAMQAKAHHVLMCGDGGNDVGALKQADVGLALLSGYGNSNTEAKEAAEDEGEGEGALALEDGAGEGEGVVAVRAEEQLNQGAKDLMVKAQDSAKLRKALLASKQKDMMAKQQEWLKEEMEARAAAGLDTGVMAHMGALKKVTLRMKDEMQKEAQIINKKHGNIYADDAEKQVQEAMGDVGNAAGAPVVRPGDASMAAPFTSRTPSVRAVVDLVRQGRCTLLSALQQMQIMMLECIISAYTLSALSLEGARSSERQMMASSWLITIASLAFSYATPIDVMSPVRPLRSIFHPAIFLSTMGQALIHVVCMYYAVTMATEAMGPELLKEVKAFNRLVRLNSTAAAEDLAAQEAAGTLVDDGTAAAEDPLADFYMLWSQPFKPNLMNTVVFLVETAQIVAVLFVNYKGRPWMKGVLENHPLFISIFACIAGVGFCAWSINPTMNAMIHLHPFPDDEFRWNVMMLVLASIAGTFVWDRICTAIFAPEAFNAMLDEAKATRFKDVAPLLITLGKGAAGLMLFGSGNIFMWIGGYWLYRKYSQAQQAQTDAGRKQKLLAKKAELEDKKKKA